MLQAEKVGLDPSLEDQSAVWLHDAPDAGVELLGAKAGALAAATSAGLPVLPGFVITTAACGAMARAGDLHSDSLSALRGIWSELSVDGTVPLIVRSSSTIEDGASSSMAGRFTTVLDVIGWPEFVKAVWEVVASGDAMGAPMAVLVQRQLDADVGGVMFGVDPVTGERNRLSVVAVTGQPEALVSGRVEGSSYRLSRRGRRVDVHHGAGGARLTRSRRRRLTKLARRTEAHFGSPQDVEWAFDRSGRLWLLQSRPITAIPDSDRRGPIFGPGPIAETFPDPLAPLEEDLWLEPLRGALREALVIAGAAPRRKVAGSPLIVTVGGRAAIDLGLLGALPKTSIVAKLDPRPGLRKLSVSWRVGRLRAALPELARDVVERLDEELSSLPAPSSLDDPTVLRLLRRCDPILTAIHGHEILAGLLLDPGASAPTGASIGLRALAEGRARGLEDEAIVAAFPETLMLVPPRIGPTVALPPAMGTSPAPAASPVDPVAAAREQLRMRVRWVQELTARAALVIGRRLAERGVVSSPEMVRWLRVRELEAVLAGEVLPLNLDERTSRAVEASLPTQFRLTSDGRVAAERPASPSAARGVSPGRAQGPVHTGLDTPVDGAVLVVSALEPGLAPLLPRLAGLISETGSELSHLAILAREFGIPTVVGVSGALERFTDGEIVLIDGSTGELEVVSEAGAAP